jgi:proline iminopeptidase
VELGHRHTDFSVALAKHADLNSAAMNLEKHQSQRVEPEAAEDAREALTKRKTKLQLPGNDHSRRSAESQRCGGREGKYPMSNLGRAFNSNIRGSAGIIQLLVALVIMTASAGSPDAFADSTPHAEVPVRPTSRAEATAIIGSARKILTSDGVQRLEKVRIGGIDQWVSVRGVDRRNPVLLYIHGGPGYVSIPMSWWSTHSWEEYFTVVQWDQRAAGKTYLLSDPGAVAQTLTNERMVADAEEMAEWARRTLGKSKIFVLGHSYGSYLGLELAKRHSDWLYAYIGVAQVANMPESERRGWQFAMEAARQDGNADAIRELQSIAPYPASDRPTPIQNTYVERKWMTYYGGAMAYRRTNDAESDLSYLSPDYTDDEIRHLWDGNAFSTPYLLPGLLAERSTTITLDVPLILLVGRFDKNVNAYVSAEWFAKVKSPSKHLIWFEHSAHLLITEEPGKALVSLVRYARPIAERAGDVAP